METPRHAPVLADEVLADLALKAGMIVVDGTVGLGGHASRICEILGPSGHLVGLDRDPHALAHAKSRLQPAPCAVSLIHARYSEIASVLRAIRVDRIDACLLDLGVSSYQLEVPERGFSFSRNGPLDMRMDPTSGQTAAKLVSELSEAELADIFYHFGEERHARRIARSIVDARAKATINTTGDLAEIVRRTVHGRGRIHPATRVFLALRIAVNDELGELERGLAAARDLLKATGRLAVLTFHSLEDRMVKNTFRAWCASGAFSLVHKKVTKPGRAEILANRRARSAKLRTIARCEGERPA